LNGDLVVFLSLDARFGPDDFNSIQDLFACPFTPDAIVVDPHPEFALAWEGSTTLVWNASPGRAYRVQHTEDLANPAWTDWPGTVTIIGARAWIHDSSRDPNSRRFYRVRLVGDGSVNSSVFPYGPGGLGRLNSAQHNTID
jgi:hypothetical protein